MRMWAEISVLAYRIAPIVRPIASACAGFLNFSIRATPIDRSEARVHPMPGAPFGRGGVFDRARCGKATPVTAAFEKLARETRLREAGRQLSNLTINYLSRSFPLVISHLGHTREFFLIAVNRSSNPCQGA